MTRQRAERRAKWTLLSLVIVLLGGHAFLSAGMMWFFPQMRDPEYGRKLLRLQARVAEHADRPLVVVLGSSRISMGLRPGSIGDDPQSPLVFNASLIGSGPLMELMCLRRLLADGVKPSAVVVEVWAPFLFQEGSFREEIRIDVNRVRRDDIPLLSKYYLKPDELANKSLWAHIAPAFTHRFYFVSQVMPGWLPFNLRRDSSFSGMDQWGWLPGHGDDLTQDRRDLSFSKTIEYYAAILAQWRCGPDADKALHELLTLLADEQIPTTLLIMPESSKLRAMYSEQSLRESDAYLNGLATQYHLPLIDTRTWADDARLPDGFHLTREGANEYTTRFHREVLPQIKLREGYR